MRTHTTVMIGLLLSVLGCASASGPARYAPAEVLPPGYSLVGPRSVYRDKGLEVAVRLIDGFERQSLIQRLSGQSVDPFGLTKDGRPFFRTVALTITNGTSEPVRFNPSFAVFEVGWERIHPKTVPEMWSFLGMTVGAGREETLFPALYDRAVDLRPGEHREGLLVFAASAERPKQLKLNISPLHVGQGEVACLFVFDRQPDP